MLLKLSHELEPSLSLRLQKQISGEDVSALGAFAHGTLLQLSLTLPRTLGVAAVVLRIHPDGGAEKDLPFAFAKSEEGKDLYTLSLDTAALCTEETYGLFYYELLFLRGLDTLFSCTKNNVDFSLERTGGAQFRLLIFEPDFHTPAWFAGRTMYHIFLDRFCRGSGKATLREDALLDPDWESGVPRFAERPGDPLANNVFFGGNLWGVIEQLDRLAQAGINLLYLSPVFEAASNHRYDTGDYERIDPLLGGEEAFDLLLREAHKRDIRVMLDGVFNHTGDDSRYFNARGNYSTQGAFSSPDSPWRTWYCFGPDGASYECWWGVRILPRLNHATPACRRYFTGADGIAARWLRRGADGWRLDVADELSDEFLDELRDTVKQTTAGEGVILGEVWENAADKIAYGKRRRYFSGRQLDSVMNYPFRNAALAFVLEQDATAFYDTMTELYSSYPPEVSRSLMNLLGTHDTDRILTVLGGADVAGMTNRELSSFRLSDEARALAVRRLLLASVLQFTVFGVPSVYYGDEAGLEGGRDPFCRMPYPWGREDPTLLRHYARLGALRREHPAFAGSFAFLEHTPGALLYERKKGRDRVLIAANAADEAVTLPLPAGEWSDLYLPSAPKTSGQISLSPLGFAILGTVAGAEENE